MVTVRNLHGVFARLKYARVGDKWSVYVIDVLGATLRSCAGLVPIECARGV